MMQLRFRPSEQDINDAVALLFRRRALFFVGIIALLAALAFFFFTQPEFKILAYFFTAATVLAIIIVIRFPSITKRNLHKAYSDLGDHPLYRIDTNGIGIESAEGIYFVRWKTFDRAIRNPKTIILSQPNRSIFILPRRLFDEQQQRSLEIYLEQIGSAAS